MTSSPLAEHPAGTSSPGSHWPADRLCPEASSRLRRPPISWFRVMFMYLFADSFLPASLALTSGGRFRRGVDMRSLYGMLFRSHAHEYQ
jgi:hypothetical protein